MNNTIPLAMRAEMAQEPERAYCSLYGQHGHVCGGRITWEHAIIAKGSKVQEKWAIIPLCERGHAVNTFQDAGTMNKELNEWVALSISTDQDLLRIFAEKSYMPLCKAKTLFDRRRYLIAKFGEYKRILPQPKEIKVMEETEFQKLVNEFKQNGFTDQQARFLITKLNLQ